MTPRSRTPRSRPPTTTRQCNLPILRATDRAWALVGERRHRVRAVGRHAWLSTTTTSARLILRTGERIWNAGSSALQGSSARSGNGTSRPG
jgi:hypothetical protein